MTKNKIFLISVLSFLCLIPIVTACRISYVPVKVVDASKYDPGIVIGDFNVNITNKNDEVVFISILPSSDLKNHVSGRSATLKPYESKNITIQVYLSGYDKADPSKDFLRVFCTNNVNTPLEYQSERDITFFIYGRGSRKRPTGCSSSNSSCGISPNCVDTTTMSGCSIEDGYYNDYYCYENSVLYAPRKDDTCCPKGYQSNGFCIGTACNNRCTEGERKCSSGESIVCEMQDYGCTNWASYSCGENVCYQGNCIQPFGKIAYMCKDDKCNAGIEKDLMNWLSNNGWKAVGKGYNSWTEDEFEDYDLILCSEQQKACNLNSMGAAYNKHKNWDMPFVEITDSRSARAAYKFKYTSSSSGYYEDGDELYATVDDVITGSIGGIKVFNNLNTMMAVRDKALKNVTDLADVSGDNARSTLFKVDQFENQGRYVFVGWLLDLKYISFTDAGNQLLQKILHWASCGNVNSCDGKPKAEASPDKFVEIGETVNFVGTAFDSDNDIVLYKWDFDGDGVYDWNSTVSGTVNHVYSTIGTFMTRFKVTDAYGATDIDTVKVTVGTEIAFLCRTYKCDDGLEPQIIGLLNETWKVFAKQHNKWSLEELENSDLIVCSDESSACNVYSRHLAYKAHTELKKPFVEFADYKNAKAAYRFDYLKRQTGGMSLNTTNISIVNTTDGITTVYTGNLTIFKKGKNMATVQSSLFESGVINLASSPESSGSSVLFKVGESTAHGRYAFFGGFYYDRKNNQFDLTDEGKDLIKRIVRWAKCGDATSTC